MKKLFLLFFGFITLQLTACSLKIFHQRSREIIADATQETPVIEGCIKELAACKTMHQLVRSYCFDKSDIAILKRQLASGTCSPKAYINVIGDESYIWEYNELLPAFIATFYICPVGGFDNPRHINFCGKRTWQDSTSLAISHAQWINHKIDMLKEMLQYLPIEETERPGAFSQFTIPADIIARIPHQEYNIKTVDESRTLHLQMQKKAYRDALFSRHHRPIFDGIKSAASQVLLPRTDTKQHLTKLAVSLAAAQEQKDSPTPIE